MEPDEELIENEAQAIISIEQLRRQIKEDLESENLDSIDDVKDLILELYEQDKGPKPSMAARSRPGASWTWASSWVLARR